MTNPPPIVRHVLGVWLFLTTALAAGLFINLLRPTPLPLRYVPPEARIERAATHLGAEDPHPAALDGDVDLDEMERISRGRSATILDARSEVFYRLGHIPGALSLPRDDFEAQYSILRSALQPHVHDAVIIYCLSEDCHDSALVADGLRRLGFTHVRLFRGGWGDWTYNHLPVETP